MPVRRPSAAGLALAAAVAAAAALAGPALGQAVEPLSIEAALSEVPPWAAAEGAAAEEPKPQPVAAEEPKPRPVAAEEPKPRPGSAAKPEGATVPTEEDRLRARIEAALNPRGPRPGAVADEPAGEPDLVVYQVKPGDFVDLINLGNASQDMTDFALKVPGAATSPMGLGRANRCQSVVPPKSVMRLAAGRSTCSMELPLSRGDGRLELVGPDGKPVSKAAWTLPDDGRYVARRQKDGRFQAVREDYEGNPTDILEQLGGFDITIELLEHFDLDNILEQRGGRRTDRWFDREILEIERSGDLPYTFLAVPDTVWLDFMTDLAGPYAPALTVQELIDIDDAKVLELLRYHVLPGLWHTNLARNEMRTSGFDYARAPTIDANGKSVVFHYRDDNTILINDNCVDVRAPQDEYGCEAQATWGKCGDAWIQDGGLYSERDRGFCEYSCDQCTCEEDACALITQRDLLGSDDGRRGAVHVIDRLLTPYPTYKSPWKEEEPKPDNRPRDLDQREQGERPGGSQAPAAAQGCSGPTFSGICFGGR